MTKQNENEVAVRELSLRSMDYSGAVNGTLAEMQLALTYENTLSRPLEPVFTFPLQAEATVLDVQVKVGNRTVKAELKKRSDARQDYNAAVQSGHHGALLEQQRDSIFTMSVGGIEPGEKIDVQIKYLHPVDWQSGGGRFITPLVVAPRFIHGQPLAITQGHGWSPDTTEVPDASLITPIATRDPGLITYKASLDLQLNPGFKAKVSSPSHDSLIPDRELDAGSSMHIKLDDLRPDRDLTICYGTEEKLPQLKLDRANFTGKAGETPEQFMLLQVVPGHQEVAPTRETILLLDCSGSMQGMAIEGLRTVTKRILSDLGKEAGSKVGVIAFNEGHRVLQSLTDVTQIKDIDVITNQLKAGGGTHLGQGIDAALAQFPAREASGVERSVILITDGQTEQHQFNRDAGKGVRIHTLGLSTAIEYDVLKNLAVKTGGSTYWVYPGENYDTAVREIVARTSGPALRNVRIESIGADAEVQGLGDIFADKPGIITVKSLQGMSNGRLVALLPNGKEFSLPLDIAQAGDSKIAPLAWAKARLRSELDEDKQVELSLKYGVLCRSTAFVSVIHKERPGALPDRVEIPVAMPHGWEMGAEESVGLFGAGQIMCRSTGGGPVRARSLTASYCSRGPDVDFDMLSMPIGSGLPVPVMPVVVIEPQLLRETKELLQGIKSRSITEGRVVECWRSIEAALRKNDAKEYAAWTSVQLSTLFSALVELKGYGFKAFIPKEVKAKPSDREALVVWAQAQRGLGVSVSV